MDGGLLTLVIIAIGICGWFTALLLGLAFRTARYKNRELRQRAEHLFRLYRKKLSQEFPVVRPVLNRLQLEILDGEQTDIKLFKKLLKDEVYDNLEIVCPENSAYIAVFCLKLLKWNSGDSIQTKSTMQLEVGGKSMRIGNTVFAGATPESTMQSLKNNLDDELRKFKNTQVFSF